MTYSEIISHFKTKEAVAAALGISTATVTRMADKKVAKHYQLAIQTLTKNKLKADGE